MVVVGNVHETQVMKSRNANAVMRSLGHCSMGGCLVT
jgi:hypothetical protein